MELFSSDVFKQPVRSVEDFAKSHGVKREAIYYAIKNNKVDYIEIGGIKLIVLTAHTESYAPNHYVRTA